jgi:hypothetical protein
VQTEGTTVPNRKRERSILRTIYREADFKVRHRRKNYFPDFILRHLSGSPPFGVEVTELYQSATFARLTNIPNYTTSLIEGAPHRHKDDITSAQVVDIQLQHEDGSSGEKMKAVLSELPPLSEYPGRVAARVRVKSAKLGSAPRNLSHVNLIMFDRDYRLGGTPVEEFYRVILTPDLKRALLGTGFREVFLVTSIKEREQCYFPLRLLFLSAETYQLFAALREFYGEANWDEAVELTAALLRRRGGAVGINAERADRVEALLGNTGFSSTEEASNIRDYADFPMPRARPPAPTRAHLLSPEFVSFFDDRCLRNFFSCEFAHDVVEVAGRDDAPANPTAIVSAVE